MNNVKFYDKIRKEIVLEDAKQDVTNTLRKIKDTTKREEAVLFYLIPLCLEKNSKDFVQDYLALLPCIWRDYLILNHNNILLQLKKNNNINGIGIGQEGKVVKDNNENLDPVLDNFQEYIYLLNMVYILINFNYVFLDRF